MMMLWRVSHPEHPAVEVAAVDRVRAVSAAALEWGVKRWTAVARECTVEELGPIPNQFRERKRVVKVKRDGTVVARYISARAAAQENYMSCQSVLDRCMGKIKKPWDADGCTYRFEE